MTTHLIESSRIIKKSIEDAKIDLALTLPETWLLPLIKELENQSAIKQVPLSREDEGIGIAAGAYLAGFKSTMIVQSSGFLNAANNLACFNFLYRFPLLMLISHRGSIGDAIGFQHGLGRVTESVLDALRIPYAVARSQEELYTTILETQDLVWDSRVPAAVLLTKRALMGAYI